MRIGRTKAYTMATEWRATNGRSGLPVVDLGNALRVRLHELEEMVGTTFDATALDNFRATPVEDDPIPRTSNDRSAGGDLIDVNDDRPKAPPPTPDARSQNADMRTASAAPTGTSPRRPGRRTAPRSNASQLALFDLPRSTRR